LSCEGARTAIRTMLRELQKLWPRKSGQGWEKAKTHEQQHVPDDIERNGAVQNYHTGPTEHNHIFHVKRLAQTTQRQMETLDQQITNRAAEGHVIDYAYQRMETISNFACPKIPVDGVSLQSSKGLLYVIVDDNGGCEGRYHATTGNLDVTDRLHAGAAQFLANQYGSQPAFDEHVVDNQGNVCHSVLRITSEYKRGNKTF
jgi:hypothetical protein